MKTHVAIILDSSGSMGSNALETVQGFNNQLSTLKEMATDEHQVGVTFTVFSDKVDVRYVNLPVNEVQELTNETYRPNGMTALYDAVGMTIVKLEDEVNAAEDDAFMAYIFSDGAENQSKEYTSETLSAVIKRLNETGKWTFSYVGSNQDLSKVSKTLGLAAGNCCSYDSTQVGTVTAFNAQETSTRNYFAARGRGATSTRNLYSDDDSKVVSAQSVVEKG